jgi:hypothetical protein
MPTTLPKIVAITGVLLAGILIVVAHRRRPELPASEVALSVYFTAPTRSIMHFAYAAIAAALISVAFLLALNMGVASLVAAVACCIGSALLVPVVATTQRDATILRSDEIRRAHRYAAAAAFASVGVAMAVSVFAAIVRPNAAVPILGALGAVLVILVLRSRPGPTHGLLQKLFLFVLGLWIIEIATS